MEAAIFIPKLRLSQSKLTRSPEMCRHMCMGLCGAQPRDTNYKPIFSLPLAPRPHRQWDRGVGGARPPGLKVDPLLNASPSFGSIHLINSALRKKIPSAHYAPHFHPSLPPAPPPSPSSMPHLHWDQYI